MTTHSASVDRHYVVHIGAQLEGEAARSLELLRDIDATCGILYAEADLMARHTELAQSAQAKVRKTSVTKPLDATGDMCAALVRGQQAAARLVHLLEIGRRSALEDPELCEDDGVVEAFDHFIEVAHEFNAAMQLLSEAVMEHDADASEVVGDFESAEALIAHLDRD